MMKDTVYKLKICVRVTEEFTSLIDSYILDYFVENHQKLVPKSWKKSLETMTLEDVGRLLDLNSLQDQTKLWPLSILTIRVLIKHVCISRANSEESDKPPTTLLFQHPKLKNLFIKHVKKKKRMEILRMANIIRHYASKTASNKILDVGCGLGHLSRLLAYGYGMEVVGIDVQNALLQQAKKLDLELEMTISKHLTEVQMQEVKLRRPKYQMLEITYDTPVDSLKQLFRGENADFGIVGLHPCGDLAPCLLTLFSNCSQIQFINVIGCCYHKMNNNPRTFPLSEFLMLKTPILSHEARGLACHALEVYSDRLKSSDYDHLKVHCYRAAIERIIADKWSKYRRWGLTNVTHTPELTFYQYCTKALKKLDLTVKKEDVENKKILHDLSQWKKVVEFYAMRLFLAPFIETIILLDRVLFLQEKGISCDVTSAFDPIESPRNLLISAWK